MPKTTIDPPFTWRKQDWAYTNLRSWILSGALAPGQRIDQDALAADLSISRVPIRQALVRLHAQGLVEQQPNQRWIVADMSLADARDVYSGRCVLEELLTRTAADSIDAEDISELEQILTAQQKALDEGDLDKARTHDRSFHNRIYQVSGLPRTWQAQQQLRAMSDRYVAMFMADIERAKSSFQEHTGILDALRNNAAQEAGRLAAAHVRGGIDLLATLLTD